MPIFEYACRACGTEFETLVRASAPAPECPSCHGHELHKKLSGFAVASSSSSSPAMAMAGGDVGACGSCGHPGGPGACQFD
jgi:putative FmdB family regulatory protein